MRSFLLAVVLGISCACPDAGRMTAQALARLPMTYRVMCDVPDVQRIALDRAAGFWNAAAKGWVLVPSGGCVDRSAIQAAYRDSVLLEVSFDGPMDVPGYTRTVGTPERIEGAVITLFTDVSGNDVFWENVLRHELGHALGYDHSHCGECLMDEVIPVDLLSSAPIPLCPEEAERLRDLVDP